MLRFYRTRNFGFVSFGVVLHELKTVNCQTHEISQRGGQGNTIMNNKSVLGR